MNSALLHQVTVPLSVPVTVAGADGKPAERTLLVLSRPKVRHAKRLAALVGSDVIDALINSEDIKGGSVEGRKLITDTLRKLLSDDRLDGLTEIIADLSGETAAVIDDVDAVDLPAVAMAFAGFFPALQSALAGLSRPTSPSAGDTTLAQ
ncbi:hypothetical protein [Shinella kummerowiae]|uniref:hypothetical protein n=1 Tax=Shinella kummerowiae TaxID=417745 RepID=UPI0021B5C8AD|nr:hypothetical protein [Shinella kummerowiae]MCT7668155.1 hypothetical protein [Shinella kummerowiae]